MKPSAMGGDSAMLLIGERLVYSVTDLVAFLESLHLADLKLAVVLHHLERPFRDDSVLDRMARRGREFESVFWKCYTCSIYRSRRSGRPRLCRRRERSSSSTASRCGPCGTSSTKPCCRTTGGSGTRKFIGASGTFQTRITHSDCSSDVT